MHEREREISNLFEKRILQNSVQNNKRKILCVPFYAIFTKKCEKKGAKQAFTFKF